jgi:selenide,water dikinase
MTKKAIRSILAPCSSGHPAAPFIQASSIMTTSSDSAIRLTAFSHGGGCGCKIAPGILADILKRSSGFPVPKELMVGIETADDAAVYKLNDEQALIATTDFFMPIVDDPYDFGRIAATNAISDVYAMGGTPIMALALVAMPISQLPLEVIGRIIQGGESVCAEAGIPIAGGHTIDSVEPIYGLVVMGLVHPSKIKRNADAKAGDKLILGKPLGVGVLSAALKKNLLDDAGYRAMIENTTKLNKPGKALSDLPGVHALTDVTGFGLLGHSLELARGAGLSVRLDMARIPLLPDVHDLAARGCVTGASGRNWAGYGQDVVLADAITPVQQALLTDPQTSGGLLVSCAADAVEDVLALFRREGFAHAAVIGETSAGPARVQVTA